MTVSFKVNRSGKSKVLSQEERNLIQTHLPEKYRLISEVLYWSAGRIREVLNIRVRNLVPDQGMVVLEKETTKTKETREVFVPDQLMKKLLLRVRSLGLSPSDYLFFNQSPTQTTKGEQRPLTVQSFDKELRRVCDWNGLSGVSSHSFRRTQLTELYREGGPSGRYNTSQVTSPCSHSRNTWMWTRKRSWTSSVLGWRWSDDLLVTKCPFGTGAGQKR